VVTNKIGPFDLEIEDHLPFALHFQQGGVSHCGLAIYIKKYLKAKEEL
jgi:hypothetical protein